MNHPKTDTDRENSEKRLAPIRNHLI